MNEDPARKLTSQVDLEVIEMHFASSTVLG
jgi:hypothetical protein